MIKVLIEKKAVIGGALDAWMMVPGWERNLSDPLANECSLEKLIDHMDHICQIAGNSLHVGIGTDLDGALEKNNALMILKPLRICSIFLHFFPNGDILNRL
jgi:membrane dipeptidase